MPSFWLNSLYTKSVTAAGPKIILTLSRAENQSKTSLAELVNQLFEDKHFLAKISILAAKMLSVNL